jgi:hypothetical protein
MRRWVAVLIGSLTLSSCGILPGGQSPTPTVPAPAASPTTPASPVPTKPAAAPASPTPVPAKPTATAEPSAQTVWVGNTDGIGVYIRRTPSMADRVRAYPDNTPLELIGEDVFGDGQRWHHVKAPDGLEGYVPVIYTVDTPPS